MGLCWGLCWVEGGWRGAQPSTLHSEQLPRESPRRDKGVDRGVTYKAAGVGVLMHNGKLQWESGLWSLDDEAGRDSWAIVQQPTPYRHSCVLWVGRAS